MIRLSDALQAIVLAFILALVTGILSACARPPITAERRGAFEAIERGWYLAGNPPAGDCLKGARVKVADDLDEMHARCYEFHATYAGCLASYARGIGGRRDGILVMVAPGYEHDLSLIGHEAAHALVKCTEMGPEGDPFDSAHSLPSVWQAAGGAASAQALSSQ
jgi:hypothetical protein